MKNKVYLVLTLIIALAFISLGFGNNSGKKKQNSYVGTKACGMCHKKDKVGAQLKVWQKSKHSKAYETLLSDDANKISQKLYGKKAIEAEECLRCHTSGYNVDESLIGKKFKIEDGVQCETCHGPGSAYKSLKIMKDPEKAVAHGLRLFKTEKDAEKFCRSCHNAESPTFMSFNYEEMWSQISHYVPKKK